MDPTLALQAEIDRLQGEVNDKARVDPAGSRATLYTGAVIAIAVIGIAAILTIFLMRPDKDNTALIAIVLAFLVPASTAFIAAAVQQVHLAVNNRLSQLLLEARKAARAEGSMTATHAAQIRQDAAQVRQDAAVARLTLVPPPDRKDP